jgi:flagellar hook-length control protein FliK
VVNGTLLPFSVGGALAAPRPLSSAAPKEDHFSGAMDHALDPQRRTLRTDDQPRPARRDEPARPREASAPKAPAAPRKASGDPRAALKKNERSDDASAKDAADRSSDDTPADAATLPGQTDTPRVEAKASGGEATDPSGDPEAKGVECAVVADVAKEAVADAKDPYATAADGDVEAADAGDPLARGRHWAVPGSEKGGPHGDAVPNGAVRRGTAGAGAGTGTGSAVKAGRAIQQAHAAGAATPGQALAQVAQAAVAAAHGDEPTVEAAKTAAVTQQVETPATKPQTSSAADALTAIEDAASNVEAVAAVTAVADSNPAGSQTHDQAQPKPQAPGAQSNAATVVAAPTPTDAVRFAVTGAAGNAAYTNAAPRGEETVLPQIVQSIRLHAVQGTTEARVQLKPEHLGALNITLKVEQNQVTATIQADVAAVRSWIESHESSLRQALSEQGLQLAKLVVQEDGHQASKDEQGGEAPRRQPRRRSWRDEDATFEVLV